MKPGFINVGPGRCGTSWMHTVFLAHPEIGMAKVKETEFFNTNEHRGIDWYESRFPDQPLAKIYGEISNNYYLDPGIASKIAAYNPDMKIIFNIRKPDALMESFYKFGIRRGLELPPLHEALDQPIGRLMGSGYERREKAGTIAPSDTPNLLESVLLTRWMQPFRKAFPEKQIYFFDYERFKRDPIDVMIELFRFLGVDESFRPENASEVVNAAIRPRVRLFGRMASSGAFVLRSVGAFSLLSRLHRSKSIKSMLFKPAERPTESSVLGELDPKAAAVLVNERSAITKAVPNAAEWWH